MFGANVTGLVKECSDTAIEPKPPWRQRKEAYIDHLPNASAGALRVSLADKLHNARAMVLDLEAVGGAVWERFNTQSGDDQLWYYEELARTFVRLNNGPMARELQRTVDRLRSLVEVA